MAEGGVHPDEFEEGVLPDESEGGVHRDEFGCYVITEEGIAVTDSLELLFARDFIAYVMRRRIPDFYFRLEYGAPCPCTPFSFRVRQAVDFYLVQESVSLYFLFSYAFMDEELEKVGFINAVTFAIENCFPEMTHTNEILRLLCLFSHFTVMAFERGIEMAPYYALGSLRKILSMFIKRIGSTPEKFFADFGYIAEDMIHENCRLRVFDPR